MVDLAGARTISVMLDAPAIGFANLINEEMYICKE